MELLDPFKKGASAPENEENPIEPFLRHIGAENLSYAVVRSLMLTRPIQLREIFNLVHALPHSPTNNRPRHRKIEGKYPILAYWQEKPLICEPCTSFLSELLTSSWRIYGPEIARTHEFGVRLWANLSPDSVTIMANLFKYMDTAYARIEKETKDALQAKSHSSAFADACSEYFGENYEITNEPQKLKDLLTWLHQDTTQSLIQRLVGGEYIENCINADKKELSQKLDLGDKLTPRFLHDIEAQKEQEPAQPPVRGKLYESNKKKAERKKRQKARLTSISQVEVSNDATNISQDTEAQSLMSLEQRGGPGLERISFAQESQASTIDNISTADTIVSTEPAIAGVIKDDVTVSPTAIQTSLKEDIALPIDREEAPHPTTPSRDISHLTLDQTIATPVHHPLDQDLLYDYQDHHRFNTETAADDNWIEVKSSRKKSKKSDQNSANAVTTTSTPTKITSGVSRRVNKQNGHEKLAESFATSLTPTRSTNTTAPLRKGRTFSNSSPSASGSRSSGSKESPPKAVVPLAVAKGPWSRSTAATPFIPKKSVTSEEQAISMQLASSEKLDIAEKPVYKEKPSLTEQLVDTEKPASSEQQAAEKKAVGKEKPTSRKRSVYQEEPTNSEEQAESQTPSTSEKQVVVTQKTVVSQKTLVSKKTVVTHKTVITEKTIVSPQPVVSEQSTSPNDTVSRSADSFNVERKSDFGSTDLKPTTVKEPLVSTNFVDKSQRDARERFCPSATESIDPGTRPNYKFLKPFSKKAKRAKFYENMAPNTRVTFTEPVPTNTAALAERLRHAGVDGNALISLAPRASATIATRTHLPLPNATAIQRSAFPGRFLDVVRANNHSTSAGNSPIPEQEDQPVIYHYPHPDVLTPENQEILDLIIKGPPYPKYPRVPKLPSRDDIQLAPPEFATKKVTVTTYDGKDIYDVLGDRCPDQLTVKDHPDVNKCIHDGHFQCAYCGNDIFGTAAAEESIICPGCGPCSETRYCRQSHLLADSMKHFEACGKKMETYPLEWSKLPIHYQSLYPYIKPLNGNMTVQYFRQMVHCLIIDSDGKIQHPFKAYYANKMPMDDRLITLDWVKAMRPFQDKGHYYLFHPCRIAAGIDIDMTICMPDGSNGCFREDQRFQRVRNAAFLTHDQSLLCVMYRRLRDAISYRPDLSDKERHNRLDWLSQQFCKEFPSFKLNLVAPLHDDYRFETDWIHVRNQVALLELANPILRAWITEDVEDDGVPADPTARWQGKHWDVVIDGPTFRAGSADRKDWGPGWYGGGPFGEDGEQVWMKELNRKYFNMVLEELAKVEMERDGKIV